MTQLESALQASVSYYSEAERQQRESWLAATCAKPTVTDAQLEAISTELAAASTPRDALPYLVEADEWDEKTEPNCATWEPK